MSQNYKIVERLNKTADAAMYPEDSPYQGDSPFGEQIREAASLIQELGAALETFAAHADVKEKTSGTIPDDMAVHVVMSELRRARAILSKLKEA
jgi:hypothetical protein